MAQGVPVHIISHPKWVWVDSSLGSRTFGGISGLPIPAVQTLHILQFGPNLIGLINPIM
jgi:hypothetical protein